MQNLLQIWSSLDLRRKVVVVGATLGMFVAVLFMSRMATAPEMSLLYSGLDPAAAGSVVAELDVRGIAHEVRGEAIFVPLADRDALRLSLASEGLPQQGGSGYELLDSLDGFGTTAQMFDAAWWRAVEGELARTILANPQITAARVHIARGQDRPFAPASDPSASVFVTASGGLGADQARALRHLVAAAVTGLRPDKVEIIDSVTGLIPFEGGQLSGGSGSDRAEAIRRSVERLLEARVGPGRAVVEVAIDLVTTREEMSERVIDPQGRVAVITETESSRGSEASEGGEVTVASNLPEADAASAGPRSESQDSRERVTYELSETRREVTRQPGDIRRMTVAVMVDGQRSVAEDGTESWSPREDEELATLRELVAAAAGVDEGRGDVLTVKSLELAPASALGTAAEAAWPIDFTRLAGVGLLALAMIALGLLLRPVLRNAGRAEAPSQLPPPASLDMPRNALTGEIQDDGDMLTFARMLPSDDELGDQPEDPVARLRRQIGERQAESVGILRAWMDASGGRT